MQRHGIDHIHCGFPNLLIVHLVNRATFAASSTSQIARLIFSMRVWLGTDIIHRLIDAMDSISLLVRYLNAEFLLDCHDDFHRV